ncbi:MAG: hypothetical protein ACOVO9_14585 [Bacteroidia bacterium]|jgi:hypothetical protein
MSVSLTREEAPIYAALKALVQNYATSRSLSDITQACWDIIGDAREEFLFRVNLIDSLIDKNTDYEDIREVLFDLLLVKFLSAENKPEEFFDSEEWDQIEAKTLDRGTELLNLFLYLSEAKEEEVEITLDDFLNEFLLVDEDEFQDEMRIYESFIKNENILEADLISIRTVQSKIAADNPIKELFVGLVLFFQEAEGFTPEPNMELSAFELSIYHSMLAFFEQ